MIKTRSSIWKRNYWGDDQYWEQIADPANSARVIVADQLFAGSPFLDDKQYDRFWQWAEENKSALGDFYFTVLPLRWFAEPEFAHLDFSTVDFRDDDTETAALIILFPTETAATLYKLTFL